MPNEFLSIQIAMNSSQDGDTILVRPGIYAEALIAPPHSFLLKGDSSPDSVDLVGPIIDPTSLPRSDTLACLTIPVGATPDIERFKFVNGAAMYPRPPFGTYFGGLNFHNSTSITVADCVFDSTYGGIIYRDRDIRPRIVVEHTVFRDIQLGCIAVRSPLHVSNCLVEGHNRGGMGGLDSVIIENCTFKGEVDLGWVGIYRSNNIVRNCTFSQGIFHQGALDVWSWGNVLVESNVFRDIRIGGIALRAMLQEGDPLIITDNTFERLTLNEFQSGGAIDVYAVTAEPLATSLLIESCTVQACSLGQPGMPTPKAISLSSVTSPCEIRRNRFIDLVPDSGPAINIDTLGNLHTFTENIFHHTAFAVWNHEEPLDATHNFWGDSTGPYHATLNPDGMGDEVRGNILFDPWYPDSNLLAVRELTPRFPLTLDLEAFPNPFNHTVRIRFIPDNPHDIYSVAIFNETGQHIADIWSGTAIGSKELIWNAANFSSGIYFARASSNHTNQSAIAKIALIK